MVFVTSRLCGRLGQTRTGSENCRWLTLTLNNSKTVLNIKKLIMSQVFILDTLLFEVKLILRVTSPLSRVKTVLLFPIYSAEI